MKNCLAPIFVLMFLISFFQAGAQPEPIRFTNGHFTPSPNIQNRSFRKEQAPGMLFRERLYAIVQFSSLPTPALQQRLTKMGVVLDKSIPGKAFFASFPSTFDFGAATALDIMSVSVLPGLYKLDAKLSEFTSSGGKHLAEDIAVDIYKNIDRQAAIEAIQQFGALVTPTKFDVAGLLFIKADVATIQAVAALPFVISMSVKRLTDEPLNYRNAATHGFSALNAIGGKNLNGKGVTMGIGDNADIASHIDFAGRLINRSHGIAVDHGTHVSGTAAGAGIINVKNRGMAPKTTIVNQIYSDIILNSPAYVADYNMVVTNNSYYSGEAGCPGNGIYDVLSSYVDRQMTLHPQLLHVAASGNDGASTCFGYLPGFGTIKSGWQTAKNVLTVGAMNTEDYSIAYFSSRGPVKDGRIKPEITAGGWAILSSNANNTYGTNFGTSMASPVVSGAVALMYERYRQKHGGNNPKSSLVKALACNTAEDLGNPGPDYTFGFGMVNARRAVEAIDSNRYFINAVSQGNNATHQVTVPPNTRRLKIMLYWADPAATVNAANFLVNDLDLTVAEPAAVVHQPLVLNPGLSQVNNIASEGADHLNNIEQVVINYPAAGNYSINIHGFAIPTGSQEYIISYEIDRSSVVVEYPFGGEKLVPGETENIRWTAHGNETNSFTVDYSADNGSSWKIISDVVPATARTIAWKVPDTITNTGVIRVSRNGTGLIDASDFGFSVLGSPVLTATNACVGAIQLNWNKIPGANSYDVLQLMGDSMKVIATTADSFFLVNGLDRYTRAWLGVTAKNATITGRRSVSIGMIPSSGTCALAVFNNDLKVDSILEPFSARLGYLDASNAMKPVKIIIRNTGSANVSAPFNVSFRYGGTTVTELITASIAGNSTYTYSFTGMYAIPAAGYRYDFKAWVSLASDGNHLNDTAYKTVKLINNDPITTLPLSEGFESFSQDIFTRPELAIGENKYIDFTSSSSRGRVRSFVNTGFSYSGNRAITLDQAPFSSRSNRDSLTFNYNLVNYNGKQLRWDFHYRNHGQDTSGANKIWVRGSENSDWIQAYDLFASQAGIGDWKHANLNLNELLESAVPPQALTPTFQIKIGQEGISSANSARPVNGFEDGYTFDDLVLNEVLNDIAVVKINSPTPGDCALSGSTSVSIKIKNYNNVPLNNLAVSYQVNGGPVVTENIPSLSPNQVLDYVFNTRVNMSAYIDYTINVWAKYASDSYATNDSILGYTVHNSPVISSFPYLEGFENNDGFFYAKGTNNTWARGTPEKLIINKAANGANAWVTNLTGDYKDNELSYLYSPCFNTASLTQPMLSFSHIFHIETGYDFTWVEYSTDGIQWQKLGTSGTGTNWYDSVTTGMWTNSKTRWHVASIALPVGISNLKIRFVLNTDGGLSEEGVGVDDFHVYDKAAIYEGPVLTNIPQQVNGSGWINFSAGGKLVAAINPGGLDLGATTVQVHNNAGAVRNSNDAYYGDRNIVVKPANPTSGKVKVRFYFTDAEVRALLGANGCLFCAKPLDAYDLGITKYSSSLPDENGLLSDDTTGFFQFINQDSTVIIPYDNGYYAEFSVNNFSEFWLSSESIKPSVGGLCPGDDIIYSAASTGTSYQWQEDAGSGFVNISNSFVYDGVTTASLQLSNYTTAIALKRYRCVVNGVAGPVITPRFVNVWTGATNADWALSSNWGCGYVPDQYTEVIIPGGLLNYPVIGSSTRVKSLRVLPGASGRLAAGVQLEVLGR